MKIKKIILKSLVASCVTTMIGFIDNCSQPVSFTSSGANSANQSSSTPSPAPSPSPSQYTTTTESFNFGSGKTGGAVDILIVDDNSGSMSASQQNLAQGFNNFISGLNGIDWQIGVTTTDVCADTDYNCRGGSGTFPPARGRLIGPADSAQQTPFGTQYILKPTTPNVATLFAQTIQRTTSAGTYLIGSGDERAIDAANMTVAGYNDPNVAQGFFRPNASLAVVILSNEDERSCGNDPACHGSAYDAPQYLPFESNDYPTSLVSNVTKTFGASKSFDVHAIIIKPGDSNCYDLENRGGAYDGGGNYGDTYAMLAQTTGGMLASLCNNGNGQYATDLTAISQSIRQTTQATITLNHTPAEEPVLTFNPPANITYTWAPGTTHVTLNSYPSYTTVSVTYKYQH